MTLEYDVIAQLDFQIITDNNQVVDISGLSGLSLAIGTKEARPSYELLALSQDYTIEDNKLTFTINTYTTNWLANIKKPNQEAYIEISQNYLGAKKVLLRDYCLVWPRTYVTGIAPEEIKQDYYTKEETQGLIETSISGYATEDYVESAVSGKQDLITSDSKLDYALLSGTPTIPLSTSQLTNDSGFITEDALSGYQEKITTTNKLDYGLLSSTPTIPTMVSQLENDNGYVSEYNLPNLISGKLDVDAYIPPYQLLISTGSSDWSSASVQNWTDTDIIPQKQKIVYINSVYAVINFPTLSTDITANEVWTCEFWINVPVFGTTVTTINVPSSWSVIGDFPTSLDSDELKNSIYVFVGRFIPSGVDTPCELAYSHKWVTNWGYIG